MHYNSFISYKFYTFSLFSFYFALIKLTAGVKRSIFLHKTIHSESLELPQLKIICCLWQKRYIGILCLYGFHRKCRWIQRLERLITEPSGQDRSPLMSR